MNGRSAGYATVAITAKTCAARLYVQRHGSIEMLTGPHKTVLRRQLHLTRRQLDLVDALLDGQVSNKDLTKRLKISDNTVKLYLQILYNKTGERSRAGLLSLVTRVLLLEKRGYTDFGAATTQILTKRQKRLLQTRLNLSPRQAQLLEALLRGRTTKDELARSIEISPHTLNLYVKLIYLKTQTHSRGGLIAELANLLLA